jgi:Uncharacterised nucleotidyltransferase
MPVLSRDTAIPEKRLQVYCAQRELDSAAIQTVREIVSQPLDWDFLFLDAAENSVTPLLCAHLLAAASDLMDSERTAQLEGFRRALTMRNLVIAAELIAILNLFRDAQIQAIPYKGPVLAEQAYGDLTLREFEDLDLVLRQRDMAKANEIIISLGYAPKYSWILAENAPSAVVPGEYNYRDDRRRMMVELHTERTLRHFPLAPDIDDLAKRLVTVLFSGHSVETFGAEDGLVLLCIHGSKDFWERLSWAADVAQFVRSQPQLNWSECYRRADRFGARRMLHLGLALAIRLFEVELPAEVLGKIHGDGHADLLAQQVEQRLLLRGSNSLSGPGRFRFRRQTLESPVAGWRYSLRLATVPAEEDWEMIRLPNFLAPLYVALRPLRLLRKYGVSVQEQ